MHYYDDETVLYFYRLLPYRHLRNVIFHRCHLPILASVLSYLERLKTLLQRLIYGLTLLWGQTMQYLFYVCGTGVLDLQTIHQLLGNVT